MIGRSAAGPNRAQEGPCAKCIVAILGSVIAAGMLFVTLKALLAVLRGRRGLASG